MPRPIASVRAFTSVRAARTLVMGRSFGAPPRHPKLARLEIAKMGTDLGGIFGRNRGPASVELAQLSPKSAPVAP